MDLKNSHDRLGWFTSKASQKRLKIAQICINIFFLLCIAVGIILLYTTYKKASDNRNSQMVAIRYYNIKH